MKKNILQVCLSLNLGGLELYMKDLTIYLKCVCVISNNSKLEDFFKKNNITYEKINKYDIFKLSKIIDKYNIDIIHFHHTKDMLSVVLAKKFSSCNPKIVQTRHMHMTRFKRDFYHKFLYKNISAIIAVSSLVKQQLHKFLQANIDVFLCYPGAKNIDSISPENRATLRQNLGIKNEFIVCIAGQLKKQKVSI